MNLLWDSRQGSALYNLVIVKGEVGGPDICLRIVSTLLIAGRHSKPTSAGASSSERPWGDALGVPYEFLKRDTFECTGMSEGGVHGKPAGTFSDDTSLLLATCASLKQCGEVDVEDMRRRFCDWLYEGAYTSDGSAFDVGNATATALERGRGCDGERSNGNGSLMRIAPLVFVHASDDEARAVSAITRALDLDRGVRHVCENTRRFDGRRVPRGRDSTQHARQRALRLSAGPGRYAT